MTPKELKELMDDPRMDVNVLRERPDPSVPHPIPANHQDTPCHFCGEPALFIVVVESVKDDTGTEVGSIGITCCIDHTIERFGLAAVAAIKEVPKLTPTLAAKLRERFETGDLAAASPGHDRPLSPAEHLIRGDPSHFSRGLRRFVETLIRHPEATPPDIHKALVNNMQNHPEKFAAFEAAFAALLSPTETPNPDKETPCQDPAPDAPTTT